MYEINEEGYVCEVGDIERHAFSPDVEIVYDDEGEIDYDATSDNEGEAMERITAEIEESMGDDLKKFALPGEEKFRGVVFTHMLQNGQVVARVSKEVPI